MRRLPVHLSKLPRVNPKAGSLSALASHSVALPPLPHVRLLANARDAPDVSSRGGGGHASGQNGADKPSDRTLKLGSSALHFLRPLDVG
jgi:hypothetical protein